MIVAPQHASASRRFLAHLVRTAASAAPPRESLGRTRDIDSVAVLALARRERVAPLLHLGSMDGRFGDSLPQEIRAGCESAYYRTLVENIAASKAGHRVLHAMQRNRISAAPVDAWALHQTPLGYYSDLGCRPIDDIEFVIRESDRGRAESVLFELGFRRVRRHGSDVRDAWTCAFRSDEASPDRLVRLRWGWDGFEGRSNGVAMTGDEFLDGLCDTTVSGGHRPTRVADLLIASVRAARPGRSRWIWLEDVHRVIVAAPIDWREVVTSARRWRVRASLYTSLLASRELLDTPIPADVLAQLAPGPIRRMLLQRSLAACHTRGATARTVHTARALLGESWWDVACRVARVAGGNAVARTRPSTSEPNRIRRSAPLSG